MAKGNLHVFILLPGLLLLTSVAAFGQGTAFTYQGKLADSGNPASGQYDFQFKLFDTATVGTGTQQGGLITVSNVTVTAGIFTVQLDFGACPSCFDGSPRFLEIAVKPTSGSTFTTLGPRQPISATPYAIKSQNATIADGLSVACVSCVTSSQIASVSGSAVNGTIPVASVPAGSANYVQNATSQQTASNFNISGDGTAGGTLSASVVNAATQFNLGGSRVLSVAGTSNLFAGVGAGAANTGGNNAFFGASAGLANIIGDANSFFGFEAGKLNTGGFNNAYFGADAGKVNSTGNANSFFGTFAGENTTSGFNSFFGQAAGNLNTTGSLNSFFGSNSGQNNTTGSNNSFFGVQAGFVNSTAGRNSFFGSSAGLNNTTGSSNTFYGTLAGSRNTTGQSNTFIGDSANFDVDNPTGDNNTLLGAITRVNAGVNNATAIGFRAQVTQSNSLVLGSINGVNSATADTNVGIGTAAPLSRLDVVNTGTQVRFGGTTADNGGYLISTTSTQAILAGGAKFDGTNWIAKSTSASQVNHLAGSTRFFTDANLTAGAAFTPTERMRITSNGDVGVGTTAPGDKLDVNGIIRVASLGAAGSTQLCRNASNQISTCSSSLRYKADIKPFGGGLDLVNRLRPISFIWKQGGARDVGFGAEEVAAVEPLFTFSNDRGEIEGVKYDRIAVALVNAIKQQQQQIQERERQAAAQQQQIKQQQAIIDGLQKIVCADHPQAELCQRAESKPLLKKE